MGVLVHHFKIGVRRLQTLVVLVFTSVLFALGQMKLFMLPATEVIGRNMYKPATDCEQGNTRVRPYR